ncbi:MAG: hypothetical protein HZB56_06960 [Deltaproteobacteria bacterium]|nr:hypothetical protein [Deltaproteobacteria bacterium]
MRRTATSAICAALLLGAGAAGAAEAGAGPKAPARPRSQQVGWSLGKLEVVVPAEAREQPEGRLAEGYTLRAQAQAVGDAPVKKGSFLMTISSFFPARDLPRQPRGLHYVSGKWRLVKEGVQVTSETARGPGIIQGTLVGALSEDPTTGKGSWTLRARLTPSQAAGAWKRGEGMLVVDDKLVGQLALTLD